MEKVAKVILQTFHDLGGEILFNLPGRGVYPLLNELPNVPSLKYVNAVHEFPLAAIADGYARGSNKPAFLSLYMSSGVMNASSPIFLAHRDRIPLIVTATQTESYAVGSNERAEAKDILEMVKAITKWAWMPPRPDRVQEAIIRAFTIACTPPMGPVFVNIPVDYFNEEVEYKTFSAAEKLRIDHRIEIDDEIVNDLYQANFPIVVMGAEAIRCNDVDALDELADRTGSLVLAEPDAPLLPLLSDSPRYGKMLGEVPEYVQEADLIVYIGVNTLIPPDKKLLLSGKSKKHIFISTDENEVNKVIYPDVSIIGGLHGIVNQLLGKAQLREPKSKQRPPYADIHQNDRTVWESRKQETWESTPMSIARLFSELRSVFPENTIVVDQCTTSAPYMRSFFPLSQPNLYYAASGSSQGWALGAGLGVKLAKPDQPIVAFTGDGGFMFGVQSLWSAVQYDIPIILVIVNNGGWNSMRTSVERSAPNIGKNNIDLGYGWNMDYEQLAKSFGAMAATVQTPEQVREIAQEALNANRPYVINAVCRRETRVNK